MDAVGAVWWLQLSRRWRAWLAVTVLLGVAAGSGLACLAGARRTASWFDRVAEVQGYPDINSSHGRPPDEADRTVGGFDGIAGHDTVIGFTGYVEGLDRTLLKYFIGAWREPIELQRPVLEQGRYPDPQDPREVLVVGRGGQRAGLVPGDELTVRFNLRGGSGTVAETFRVTGLGSHAVEALADTGQDRSAVYFTPAFTAANNDRLRAWSATAVRAAPGTTIGDLEAQVLAAGWSVDETRASAHDRIQEALRPLVVTLVVLGALLLLATAVLAAQVLARRTAEAGSDHEAMRALGFTPRQLLLVDLVSALSAVVPGVLLGVVLAIALSPLAPAGAVRRLEPARGVDVDLTVLGLGLISLVLVIVGGHAVRGWLSGRPDRGVARPFLVRATSGPALSGVRFATGGTHAQRRNFVTTVGLCALALVLMVAGISFAGSLERLIDEPVRYGVGWELTARNAFGDLDPEDLRELFADDDDIEGFSAATVNSVLVDGQPSPMLAVLPVTKALWPTVVDGDVPDDAGEVLVGESVLDQLDAEIGDQVDLASPYADDPSSGGGEATIVGTAIFPSVELAGIDPTRLDKGIAMTWERYQQLYGERSGGRPDVVFIDLVDGVSPERVIARHPDGLPDTTGIAPTEWLPSLAPAEIREADRTQPLVWTVVALLAGTVVATIAHSLIGAVRRNRADYAVLKALGFTRQQVVTAVTSQSLVTMTFALLVAIPVGSAVGRTVWRLFAGIVGVIDAPVLPVLALLLVVVFGLVGGVLVAAGPGLLAARTKPAVVLVDE